MREIRTHHQPDEAEILCNAVYSFGGISVHRQTWGAPSHGQRGLDGLTNST